MDVDPPRQEVRLSPPQLSRAGARKEKAEAPRVLVQKQLHHVEQRRRNPLNLVQEHRAHGGRRGQEFAFKPFGIADEVTIRALTG